MIELKTTRRRHFGPLHVEVRSAAMSHPRSRTRSASVGRDKKSDLQARYWAFLFQNLRRSVDDLYTTCEGDDSIPAAKEVILILENYVKDFKNLTDWLKLKWDYENTPPPNRPTSLSWDVRMTSSMSPNAAVSLLMTSSKKARETPGVIKEVVSPEQEIGEENPMSSYSEYQKSSTESQESEVKQVDNHENQVEEPQKEACEIINDECCNPPDALSESEVNNVKSLQIESKDVNSLQVESKDVNSLQVESKDIKSLQTEFKDIKSLQTESKDIKSLQTESKDIKSLQTESKDVQSLQVESKDVQSLHADCNDGKPLPVESSKESKSSNYSASIVVQHRAKDPSKRIEVIKHNKPDPKAVVASINSSSLDDKTKSSKSESSSLKISKPLLKPPEDKPLKSLLSSPMSKNGGPSVVTKTDVKSTRSTLATNARSRSTLMAGTGVKRVVVSSPTSGPPKGRPAFKHGPPSQLNRSITSKPKASLSPRNQRLSLVARQGLKNSNNGVSNNPKVPSGVECKSNSHTNTSRPRPVRSLSNLVRPVSSNIRKYNNSHGSNSSVHSNSSIRSWAETVRGSSREEISAGSSVDNLVADEMMMKRQENVVEEEDGWRTVKSKSRSRSSLLSQRRGTFNAKSRFRLPSSAASLPCLLSEEPEVDEEKENKNQNGNIKKSSSFRKGLVSTQTTTTTTTTTPKKNKEKSLSKVKEGLLSLSNENVNEEPIQQTELTEESIRAHNESLNVAIAKAEVAIAEAEEEEENLVREIMETEKAELTEDTDGDTDVDKRSDSASSTNEVASLPSNTTPATPLVSNTSVTPPPIPSLEGLSWVEQIEIEDQLESARYPGRAIHLHEKLSSPARKKEPHEAFRAHQEKHIRAQARRSKFQEDKALKLSALNTRIMEVMAKKEVLIHERSEMILDKMRKAEVKRMEHIEGIRKKAHEEDAKLKEIAFINELQAQNARIEVMAHNQTADEKCEGRLAEIAEERAKKAEQREAKEARAVERRREIELQRIKDVEKLKERIRSREERIEEEQKQLRKDRIEAAREKARDREERLSTVRAAEQGMKEELQEKIALKQEIAAKRHRERLEIIRTKAFELSVQRGLKDDDASVPRLQPYEPRKKCQICGVLILNEVQLLSHIRGKLHTENVDKANEGRLLSKEEIQNCNVTRIVDVGENEHDPKISLKKERSKSMKKKAKKIRNRLLTHGFEAEACFTHEPTSRSSPHRAKIVRALRDIDKLLNSQGKGSWPNSSVSTLDRSLGEISRSFDKRDAGDQFTFFQFEGFTCLTKIFNLLAEQKNSCIIPLKSICCVAKICSEACIMHSHNTEYLFMSNSLILIVEILRERLDLLIPEGMTKNDELDNDFHHLPDWPIVEPVAQSILDLLTVCLNELSPLVKAARTGEKTELISRVQDQISYIISIGIVDQLGGYFHKVQDSIDNKPEVGEFILSTLRFLSSLTSVVEEVIFPDNPSAIAEDPTHLFGTLRHTDLVGLVSMLYGMLLHQDRPPRDAFEPVVKFPEHILKVAFAAATLLHRMVRSDLEMVQDVLGSEGISLEFRHIASYLLWYCLDQEDLTSLLHEIIILVGYFAAGHKDNQLIVKSGHQPSILQQLCILPFSYFCQPTLKRALFPTLLACCHDNKENLGILSEELNWCFIDDFIGAPDGKNNHLVQLVLNGRQLKAVAATTTNGVMSSNQVVPKVVIKTSVNMSHLGVTST